MVVALERALEAAGSQSALARVCGVTQQAVFKWIRDSKPLPPVHVLKVEAATGVSRYDLRPDIYPPEESESDLQPGALRSDNHRVGGTPMDPLP